VRQYKTGKYQSGRLTNGNVLLFKTLIKPSDKSIKRHYENLRAVIDEHENAPQAALISRMNPVIRGWSNYYSTVVSCDQSQLESDAPGIP
jgi:RNA-directed DNA polymerase